jgi:hypothetical protein
MLQGCSHGTHNIALRDIPTLRDIPALRDIPTPCDIPTPHDVPTRATFPPRATHIPHPRSLPVRPVFPVFHPHDLYSLPIIPMSRDPVDASGRGSGGAVSCSTWREPACGGCRRSSSSRYEVKGTAGARCKAHRRRGGNQGGPPIPGASQRVRGVVVFRGRVT